MNNDTSYYVTTKSCPNSRAEMKNHISHFYMDVITYPWRNPHAGLGNV